MFLKNHPEVVEWSEDGTILMMPNIPQINRDMFIKSPKNLKNNEEGFEVNAWYIHPKQLEESVFCIPENRKDFGKAAAAFCYVPSLEPKDSVERHAEQERIQEIEERSGIPYLVSIFDLNKSHLPWLKMLKKMSLEHLGTRYDVTSDDTVFLYFNPLIDTATTTLHLHIKVNQALHPREEKMVFMLDDIIKTLEHGGTINDLVMTNNPYFRSQPYDLEFF